MTAGPAALDRRLGTADAVVLGLGSMMGAGVFAVWGPAARVAGVGVLLGLLLAGAVAYCNAVASAQLAAAYPTSGGTYVYGRERLGEWWGFAAGWAFLSGKTASCAAMALTVASYAVDGPAWVRRLVAVAAVIGIAAVNYRGVTKTALLSRVLVAATVLALVAFVVAALTADTASGQHLRGWSDVSLHGVLQAGALLFFAFAGYARIATMGEEVRDPATTIPRAIPLALALAGTAYLLVGLAALVAVGVGPLAGSPAPLATALADGGRGWLAPFVRLGAALAALGALLGLVAGIGRTSLAMAREADLPRWLGAVHPRFRVPHHAEIAVAVVVCVLVCTLDLRGVLGFSSFGVLLYYAIANASAFTQPAADRRWPRVLQVAGLAGCVVLALSLPLASVLSGVAVLTVGLLGRVARVRRRTNR